MLLSSDDRKTKLTPRHVSQIFFIGRWQRNLASMKPIHWNGITVSGVYYVSRDVMKSFQMNSSGTKPTGREPQPSPSVSRDWIKFDNILFAVTVLSSLLALVYYVNWP
jgi:hypothetical protein